MEKLINELLLEAGFKKFSDTHYHSPVYGAVDLKELTPTCLFNAFIDKGKEIKSEEIRKAIGVK